MHRSIRRFSLPFLLLLAAVALVPAVHGEEAGYWPDPEWRTSTPEEQGIDAGKLVEMFKYLQAVQADLHSVLIIRHGYLVAESYLHPYTRDDPHNLKSVSKSFLSALTGIALREKILSGLDQKLCEIFPEYFDERSDPQTREITLRHLLTMTAGLSWQENSPASIRLWASQNWVKYALEMPMVCGPGERFNYSTALTHLISAALTKTSGQDTLSFAKVQLFEPLGITNVMWRRDPQGIFFGGSELFLTPRDMASFGYLYLHEGQWHDRQIVPWAWVEESTKLQVKTGGSENYGYWWWLPPSGGYAAEGWGGQRIIVRPDLDLVVVFTAADHNLPGLLFSNFVLPAVSTQPLPPNPQSNQTMSDMIRELAQPTPKHTPLPALAKKVSGKVYTLEANDLGVSSFRLDFKENDACTLTITTLAGELQLAAGLDGVYRLNKTGEMGPNPGDNRVALRGTWPDKNSFTLDWHYVGDPTRNLFEMTFKNNTVTVKAITLPQYLTSSVNGRSGR